MSGGNKVIGEKAANRMLVEMNKHINELKKSTISIQRAIDNMLEDCGKGKTLQGKGFEAIEDYFTKTYKELIHDLNCVCELLIARNKDLMRAILNNIFMETSIGVTSQPDLYEEIEKLIEERQQARKEKNFARADEIRDLLKAQGITLKDTPRGVQIVKE